MVYATTSPVELNSTETYFKTELCTDLVNFKGCLQAFWTNQLLLSSSPSPHPRARARASRKRCSAARCFRSSCEDASEVQQCSLGNRSDKVKVWENLNASSDIILNSRKNPICQNPLWPPSIWSLKLRQRSRPWGSPSGSKDLNWEKEVYIQDQAHFVSRLVVPELAKSKEGAWFSFSLVDLANGDRDFSCPARAPLDMPTEIEMWS